jgi:hypothetical protein
MRLRSIPSLGVWCAAFVVPYSVFGQDYVPQLLETPEGYARCTAVQSNDAGVVIGTCDGRAVAWRDGVPEVLPLPSGFAASRGTGVNADGTFVGNCCVDVSPRPGVGSCSTTLQPAPFMAACLWKNGAVGLLPMPAEAIGSGAAAINSLGDVAGTLWLPTNVLAQTRAVVWSADGQLTRLLLWSEPGPNSTWSADINDHGAVAVVGTFASSRFPLVWTESAVIALPGGDRPIVSDINNNGAVVGFTSAETGMPPVPLLWQNGLRTILQIPNVSDFCKSNPPISCPIGYGVAINDIDDVIGYSQRTVLVPPAALLWRGGVGVGEFLSAAPGFALSKADNEPFGARSRFSNAGIIAGSIGNAAALLVPAQRDVTPPTLLLPADIEVDATSPAGATVTYAVSATDDVDPTPVVTCSPPSGSTFPLLATTVTCTATDAAGNTASGTFEVLVKDANQQLEDTIGLIVSWHVKLGTSLPDKLELARGFFASGAVNAGCAMLHSFNNQVKAQSGKKLTVDQGSELTVRTVRIWNVSGC